MANELRQETGGGSSGREGVGGEEFWERVGPQETDKPVGLSIYSYVRGLRVVILRGKEAGWKTPRLQRIQAFI